MNRQFREKKHKLTPKKTRNYKPTLSGDPKDPTVYHGMKVPASLKAYMDKIGPKRVKELIIQSMPQQT